jgi:hypothetical protein
MNKEIEYKTLKNQIVENNKYAFERPIVLTFLISILFCMNSQILWCFIPLIIVIMLFYNIENHIKKLKKSNKILIYIQLALEKDISYIGWETFLSHYEYYFNKNEETLKATSLEDIEERTDIYNSYKFIRKIHLSLSCIMLVISFTLIILTARTEEHLGRGDISLFIFIQMLLSAFIFLIIVLYFSDARDESLKEHFSKEKYIITQVLEEINNPKNPTI